MEQVHDSINGGHFNGKAIFHKLLRLGYYWPSMEKDCILHVQKNEKYQKHSNLKQAPSSQLATMISPYPFAIQALDFIGVINPKSSEDHKLISVTT